MGKHSLADVYFLPNSRAFSSCGGRTSDGTPTDLAAAEIPVKIELLTPDNFKKWAEEATERRGNPAY